jgi:hypothetical protein
MKDGVDFRGESMGEIGRAHELSQQQDTRAEIDTHCHACQKRKEVLHTLMACARCKSVVYCSVDCQREDW